MSSILFWVFEAGWGFTREGGQKSPTLLQVQIPVIDKRTCKDVFRRIRLLRTNAQFGDGVICAGMKEGESGCKGDSGGPLILPMAESGPTTPPSFYQIGIVSTHEPYQN